MELEQEFHRGFHFAWTHSAPGLKFERYEMRGGDVSPQSPLDVVRFIWQRRIRVFCRGGLIGGSRRVDGDTRAEEKGWGGDGVRNGLCGCRWTTALIAPPRLMPRNVHKCSPDSTWYRDSHALASFIHLWRPLLGHLPSLFLYFLDHGITTRQLKGGLKADPIKRDLVLFYLMLSRAVCKIFKKLGELTRTREALC